MKLESSLIITYLMKSSQDVKKKIKEIVGQVYAMETSYSRDLFFCAGSTARDASGRSEGMLAAVTFDRSMNLVVEKVLDRLDIQACTAIRRFPGTDDLAVGCFRDLFIVSWAGDDFIINNVIKNVHTSKPINFLCFRYFCRYCNLPK